VTTNSLEKSHGKRMAALGTPFLDDGCPANLGCVRKGSDATKLAGRNGGQRRSKCQVCSQRHVVPVRQCDVYVALRFTVAIAGTH
jgi:hypothetical protein